MAVYLAPIAGVAAQFFDNNGTPLAGGKIYTYSAGTTTPAVTYTTNAGVTQHTNPIILDAGGRVPNGGEVWQNFYAYKFVLKTSADALIATWDNIRGIGAAVGVPENFTGDGTTIAFTLSNAPYSEDSTNIYINGVYQQKNTYSVANAVITFSEAPPETSSVEVFYS